MRRGRDTVDDIRTVVSRLLRRDFPAQRQAYGFREAILYALGLGLGVPATDPAQRPFVLEGPGLRVLPSMAVVLASPGFWLRDADPRFPWQHVLHMRQELEIHRPLLPEDVLTGRTLIEAIHDKGAGRGAVLVTRHELADGEGRPVATARKLEYCRGMGGFGGEGGPRAPGIVLPDRDPDHVAEWRFPEQAALLYRLNGDLNPLHVDPAVAREAGFARPVQHGLCTYGAICWLIVRDLCGGDPARLRALAMDFTLPIYPGDAIRLLLWRVGDNHVFAAERDGERIVANGLARLA
jgi:acyl dehydratase